MTKLTYVQQRQLREEHCHEGHICSAMGCQAPSIGIWHEIREVPAWRHPPDRAGQRAYEIVATVYYCAEHERAAKSINCPATCLRDRVIPK
jgi:hypothetical protein